MSSLGNRLGYGFTPTPKRALAALSCGDIDATDYVLLAVLHDRMNHVSLRVEVTLPQLVARTNWRGTPDALYRRFRRLARSGWFGYRSHPGRHRHAYVVTLNSRQKAAASPSGDAPSTGGTARPSTLWSETPERGDSTPVHVSPPSELGGHRSPARDPSNSQGRPSTEGAFKAAATPADASVPPPLLRAPQMVRGEPEAVNDDGFKEAGPTRDAESLKDEDEPLWRKYEYTNEGPRRR